MTVKITGTPFDEIVPGLQKALDGALANTLNLQQGELGIANPKDSGRMASSWFIGQNQPRRDTRPEDFGTKAERKVVDGKSVITKPGSQTLVIEKFNGKITFEGAWYISNNVPYAQPIALQGGYPRSWGGKPVPSLLLQKDWYTSISNRTGQVFAKEFNKLKP